MDVTVTESGPCRKALTIVVPPERIKTHVDEVFKSAANQIDIKGFRKGKIPRSVLQKRFGDEIMSEAKMSLINQCFQEAVGQHDLAPLGDPEIDGLEDGDLDPAAALEFKVQFDVRPHVELGSVRGIEVARGSDEVTEDDINKALGQLADEKRTLKTVEGAVSDGDFVKADLVYKNEAGEPVHERKDARLNTNIPIAGTDQQTFADQLSGTEQGQQLQMDLTYPDSFEKEEVRGQKGTVEVAVLEVLRVIPAPIDDTLAQAYDFENIDAMKADLTTRLAEEKKRSNERRKEEDVFNVLINENQFDLPTTMVEQQAKHSLDQFRARMREGKLEEAEIEAKAKEAEGEAQQDAERRVRLFFVLEAVADKEKIFVTESDVDLELRSIAAQNNVSVDQVREYHEEHKLLQDLRLGLKERKVRDFLREHAKLTD